MSSKPWSDFTKSLAVVGILVLSGLAMVHFSRALAPLAVAVVIAAVLTRPVNWIARRTPVGRNLIATVVYITSFIGLALVPTALTPILILQFRRINLDLGRINEQVNLFIAQPIVILGLAVDLRGPVGQMTRSLADMLSPLAGGTLNILFGIPEGAIWEGFIFVVGFYLLLDADKFGDWFDRLIPPDYRPEAALLRREIGAIWNSFLVRQLILCSVMGVTVGGAMALLGVRSALVLGLVAALAELVPTLGHAVSAFVGVAAACLEGSTYLPVGNAWLAVIVVVAYIAIGRADLSFFSPHIVGRRPRLPAAVVVVGLIAGASMGGVLGLLLAAPTLASLRVLGSYVYRRLLDLEPYVLADEEGLPAPQTTSKAAAISSAGATVEESHDAV